MLHMSYPQIFLALALMNMAVALYVYSVVPEFTLRFLSWVLVRLLYRPRVQGLDNIPKEGPAVLVCNHVSFADWLIISGMCPRPVRYIMYYKFFDVPVLKYLMKQAKVIPIAGAKEDAELLRRAYEQISAELRDGEIVCIFPEGQITRHGELNEFKTGIEKIVARDAVPVVPMALKGLWGTFFSFGGGKAFRKLPRRWLSRIELTVGRALAPQEVKAAHVGKVVQELLDKETA
jgi:1-acyl-sn-glycerol-3-phosphate acyltransferase